MMVRVKPGIEIVENWRGDALSDKGLFSIAAKAVLLVGNPVDFFIFFLIILVGSVGSIVAVYFGQLRLISRTVEQIHDVAYFGANLSVCILGFLIAGFSIFSTMVRPELFRTLAKIRSKGRSVSDFKFTMYNFLYVFFIYILYLNICTICVIFMVKNSPIWYLAKIIHQNNARIVEVISAICLTILISCTVYAVLNLRSFVWNLYQGILFAIFSPEPLEDKPTQDGGGDSD